MPAIVKPNFDDIFVDSSQYNPDDVIISRADLYMLANIISRYYTFHI